LPGQLFLEGNPRAVLQVHPAYKPFAAISRKTKGLNFKNGKDSYLKMNENKENWEGV
jgi:hypothetical protein